MKEVFREFLFNEHILVSDMAGIKAEDAFCTVVSLAKKFGIRIVEGAEMANPEMIKDAAHNLGEFVPEPFYRGFPQSVRALTSEQLLFDQLYHYTQTYGIGWFDEVGHSTMEEVFKRLAFNEKTEPKDFRIYNEERARQTLIRSVCDFLKGNRPLDIDRSIVVWEAWQEYGEDILPEWIPCKQNAVMLLCKTRNIEGFGRYLKLPDVIKVLDYIQYHDYGSENLKKLNLKNQDRKLLAKLIDSLFERFDPDNGERLRDIRECFEKRKIWCGLLHHIHYRPKNGVAERFVSMIRKGDNMSYYSDFEDMMANGATIDAAEYLKKVKGSGMLLRNLNYILSRCESDEEVEEVLSCLTK